jgi:hypothetical protein
MIMVTDKDDAKAPPEVREAIDASDNDALRADPGHEDGKADIAIDESFPASDPPGHTSSASSEPAPSSGYDEVAETKRRRIAERAHRHWEVEGQPEGRDVEHWLRAEAEDADTAEDGP